MDKEIKDQWLTALRSGDYKQGKNRLRTPGIGEMKYCCLGVLCDIAADQGQGHWEGSYFHSADMTNSNDVLPSAICMWADLPDGNPDIEGPWGTNGAITLAQLNDDGLSFREIANIIEREF